METELARAVKDAVLRRMAGEQTYHRGHDYYVHGHVLSLDVTAAGIQAIVRGTLDYAVTLTADEGILDYACDCPQGGDGAFCKHCVATALAWLNSRTARPKTKSKRVSLADAAKMLQAEDHETLVQMVMGWAQDDRALRDRLVHYAARRSGPEAAVAAAQQAIETTLRIRGFVPYAQAGAWAGGVNLAIDNLDQLLHDGQAAAAVDLCELALTRLERAAGSIDDSAGYIYNLSERLQMLHFAACEQARPDPVALAARLFARELYGGIDIFSDAAEYYAPILGAKGLQAYRLLAQAEWDKVPVRTAKDHRGEWGQHFAITRIMTALARVSGDVEELIAVMSRDLSQAYRYLEIAQVYANAGQQDQSLLWAEKGLQAFPDRTDSRLREFAAEEYHSRRRHDDAMQLMWAQFSDMPCVGTYGVLERHAKRAGGWPAWRNRALDEIRLRLDQSSLRDRLDHSFLVEIFLHENDVEAAWREAQQGGCSGGLWLKLAAAREKDFPADVAPIYLKQAEAAVAAVSNGRYQDAVGLLMKTSVVMQRLGRGNDFVHALEGLRMKYKNKRNFMKLVEEKRELLYP